MQYIRLGALLWLVACTSKSGESTGTTSGTTGGGGGGGGNTTAPLSNGPGDSVVLSASCAPNDGPAWSLLIGLGAACDAGAPDPSAPFVHINIYDGPFMASPLAGELSWTDSSSGSLTYAPDGSNGALQYIDNAALHITSWESWSGEPTEVGAEVTGWYTTVLDDGTEIGAAFSGPWCGGSPMCG